MPFLILTQMIATVTLITLHQGDGRPVDINPESVSRLVTARQGADPKKQFADNIHCLVWFDDSYFGVTETCAEVRMLIEGAR